MASVITRERDAFHGRLLEALVVFDKAGIASNADKDNRASVSIARGIADRIASRLATPIKNGVKLSGQTAGDTFEKLVCEYVKKTFPALGMLRPGNWAIQRIDTRAGLTIATFDQYRHLEDLAKLAKNYPALAIVLGNDYTIAPDVIIGRNPEPDSAINSVSPVVDRSSAQKAAIRAEFSTTPLLHASISCKWTMRSDRAQNSRSEALNLIRNRKGRTPHIVVVTGEPTPSRLSSLALGTGDIDCVYHFALDELEKSVEDIKQSEATDILASMIQGKRLKDISDLPLDLAI